MLEMADGDMNVNQTERGRVTEDVQIDLMDRDPNDLNSHIGVMFDDIIGEPEGAHSADCVWVNSYKAFTAAKRICYMILTYICAIPMAVFWGCTFACISFEHIWHITPCFKVVAINMSCAQRFFTTYINCFLTPCIEAQALIFSKIHVTLRKE